MLSAVAVLFTLAGSMLGANQLSSTPADLAWVGFYNGELLEALENENRLGTLCPPSIPSVEAREQCRGDMLKPRAHVVSLRTAPTVSAAPAGSLLLLAEPGRGMRFYYIPPEGGTAREFTTDLYLADWGYGPYYHQTFLDRRGDWFLLPQDPFPASTWFNAADLGEPPHLEHAGGIVSSPRGNLVILAVEPEVVRVRPEQPGDMWCEAGEPPQIEPSEELRIRRAELYTPTGHLLLAPAHMKGC